MKRFKKIWLTTIILAVISGILIDYLTLINIPGAIWKVITWFMHLFLFKTSFPVWGIILLMLTIPFLIILFILLFYNKKSFKNYTSDTFFGVLWEWDYDFGEIYKEGIRARCPQCKTILKIVQEPDIPFGHIANLKCTHCGFHKKFTFDSHELRDRVKKEIDRKIITEEYKKIVQQAD